MSMSAIQGFDESGQSGSVLERRVDRADPGAGGGDRAADCADRGTDETDRRADEAGGGVGGGIGEASQDAGQFLGSAEPGAEAQSGRAARSGPVYASGLLSTLRFVSRSARYRWLCRLVLVRVALLQVIRLR